MAPPPAGYELLEHTADIRVRAFGPAMQSVFIQAARGMTEVLAGANQLNRETEGEAPVHICAADAESLLVDWLAELLYLSSVHRRVFIRFRILTLTPNEIRASAGWCSAALEEEIKAVTHHGLVLSCDEKAGRWEATVTFDL